MSAEDLSWVNKKRLESLGFCNIHAYDPEDRPFIHRRFLEMAKKAGIKDPQLFLGGCKWPRAGAINEHQIIISDSLLKMMDDREAVSLLAHEIGHCINITSHMLVMTAPGIGSAVGGLLGFAAGMFPSRKSVFTIPENETELDRREFAKACLRGAIGIPPGIYVGYKLGQLPARASEDQADDIAVELSEDREAFVSAMQKLVLWNRDHGERDNFFSHLQDYYRSPEERIRRIENKER